MLRTTTPPTSWWWARTSKVRAITASDERSVTDLVEQPAKVMRIGSMIRQLLEEVRAAPLDEASRKRLKEIHRVLHQGARGRPRARAGRGAGAAVAALHRGERHPPSDAELRIAHAQLVGWLEGLFHGIQTTLFAQQMAARAQLEQMRRALPGVPHGEEPGQRGPHRRLRPLPVEVLRAPGRRRRRRWPRSRDRPPPARRGGRWRPRRTCLPSSAWAGRSACPRTPPPVTRLISCRSARVGQGGGLGDPVGAHLDQPLPLECVAVTRWPTSPCTVGVQLVGVHLGVQGQQLGAGPRGERPPDRQGPARWPDGPSLRAGNRTRARNHLRTRPKRRARGRSLEAERRLPRAPVRR